MDRTKFPADLVESLRCHDGVSPGHGLFQFPGGDQPLGIDAILRRGRMDQQLWNRLGEDHPDETYWHPEFLMFADSNPPDGLVLDCREGATFGAVGTHLKGGRHELRALAFAGSFPARARGRPRARACDGVVAEVRASRLAGDPALGGRTSATTRPPVTAGGCGNRRRTRRT
ncbi:SMI1/KNR4 family protein [Streptomyces pratensis]